MSSEVKSEDDLREEIGTFLQADFLWMVINAVFELLTDDWYRTDSREVSNYRQLIDVGEIREDSRVQDARVRWNIVTCHLARDSSSDESSSPNSSSLAASTS